MNSSPQELDLAQKPGWAWSDYLPSYFFVHSDTDLKRESLKECEDLDYSGLEDDYLLVNSGGRVDEWLDKELEHGVETGLIDPFQVKSSPEVDDHFKHLLDLEKKIDTAVEALLRRDNLLGLLVNNKVARGIRLSVVANADEAINNLIAFVGELEEQGVLIPSDFREQVEEVVSHRQIPIFENPEKEKEGKSQVEAKVQALVVDVGKLATAEIACAKFVEKVNRRKKRRNRKKWTEEQP